MTASESTTKISYSGRGLTSAQEIAVEIEPAKAGTGIVFEVGGVSIEANAANVVNTLRNVVLGKEGVRLCIVEHFLGAASLYGLTDIKVKVAGPELPLGDGSASFWLDLFEKAMLEKKTPEAAVALSEPIIVSKGDRVLMALPDDGFSVNYMMDWNHPAIGKRWASWASTMDVREIGDARTFGPLKEHQMLGIADQVVSLTETGFSMPLRFEDEPVRHKLLDLIGDLSLCGINPLSFKARFISIKAGHELDVQMALSLKEFLAKKS